MNKSRVQELIAAYGAELPRWPESERAAAQAVLDALPEDDALLLQLREAAQLDASLNDWQLPEPNVAPRIAALLAAVDQLPMQAKSTAAAVGRTSFLEAARGWWTAVGWWRPALVALMPAVLGFVLGMSELPSGTLLADGDEILASQISQWAWSEPVDLADEAELSL